MIRALAVAAALFASPAAACPWPAPEVGGVQNVHTRRLDTALGEPLADRMRRLKVPGLGVAVLRGGRVAWARGWGMASADRCTPVTAHTAFQAASLSKSVAALTIVRLSLRGRLDLDADIATYLKRWRPPPGLTLRALLSHTAGLGTPGFPGYPAGAPLPTLPQILSGLPPANTPAVRIEGTPGTFAYSGGGYEVAELAVADTVAPFTRVAAAEVLRPLGLAAGYAVPAVHADAHAGGRVLPGRHHRYPEAAAAGLWSTPADIARLLAGLLADSPALAVMAKAPTPGQGLGLKVDGEGAARRIGHTGSNAGYRALMLAFPATGDGVVVMTNAEEGWPLVKDVAAAIAADLGWPAALP